MSFEDLSHFRIGRNLLYVRNIPLLRGAIRTPKIPYHRNDTSSEFAEERQTVRVLSDTAFF